MAFIPHGNILTTNARIMAPMMQSRSMQQIPQVQQRYQPPPMPKQSLKKNREEMEKLEAKEKRQEFNGEIAKLSKLTKPQFRKWLKAQVNDDPEDDDEGALYIS